MLEGPLECERVAVTYRRMPQRTGGKGSYGHRHHTQEEVYVVLSGRLEFKLDDDVVDRIDDDRRQHRWRPGRRHLRPPWRDARAAASYPGAREPHVPGRRRQSVLHRSAHRQHAAGLDRLGVGQTRRISVSPC
jgi:hypothetical protein